MIMSVALSKDWKLTTEEMPPQGLILNGCDEIGNISVCVRVPGMGDRAEDNFCSYRLTAKGEIEFHHVPAPYYWNSAKAGFRMDKAEEDEAA